MKTLVLNTFSYFPAVPPPSPAAICGLLKSNALECAQIDINLATWLAILDPAFLRTLDYRPERFDATACPYATRYSRRRFYDTRTYVCRNINRAMATLRDPGRFYSFNQFTWALGVLYETQCTIYHHFGTFITNHMTWWPSIGFEVQDLEAIDRLARDTDHNPFIPVYERSIVPRIREAGPRLILMDIVFPWDILPALTLQRIIRRHCDAHINFPGYGFDEFSFSRLRNRLERDPRLMLDFDSVFLYRNDEGLLRLVAGGPTPETTREIANLAVRGPDGTVRINAECRPTHREADPVPDYSDLPLADYIAPELVLIDRLTSRCFWAKCNYCSINARKTEHQTFDLARMIAKLDYYENLGCRTIWLLDEACPPAYARRFALALRENNRQITWSLRTRVDPELDRAMLGDLFDAGLRELWLGLEHVDPRILRIMNKSPDPDQYRDVASRIFRDCADIGIGLHFCLILGTPSETEAERKRLIEFFADHAAAIARMPFFATFNNFSLMVDSPMYLAPERFGITEVVAADGRFNMEAVPYRTRWGDETTSAPVMSALEKAANRMLAHFAPEAHMQLIWFYVSDSPWELLWKKRCSSTGAGNPFVSSPSTTERLALRTYLAASALPWLSPFIKELAGHLVCRMRHETPFPEHQSTPSDHRRRIAAHSD